jgi:Arc/MetJ-type ribon-helix-helix transcriptional regulator
VQLDVPADIESLINKRLSSGTYTSAADVLRSALNALDADENWQNVQGPALAAHIEDGYRQAERGELLDAAASRQEIQAMKDNWRSSRR